MSAAVTIEIHVNDRPTKVGEGATLDSLLHGLGLSAKKGVASAVNGSVVPRASWAGRSLLNGDKVLIIQATQGG